MGFCAGLVRYSVGLLAFITWLMGAVIIAYVLWMLSTSTSTLKAVFEGTTPVTYVAIGAGSLLFTNGLLGWMGSSNKRGGCMLKLFLVLGILTIAAEIGGIITLSILRVKVSDIVEQGWMETNLKTRHLLQEQFECCGLTGPSEYAKTAEVIDMSCYHRMKPSDMSKEELESFNNSTLRPPNGDQANDLQVLHKVGCKQQLLDWFFKHMLLWVAGFGCFLFFQALCFCLTVSALSFKARSLDSLDRLQSNTYM